MGAVFEGPRNFSRPPTRGPVFPVPILCLVAGTECALREFLEEPLPVALAGSFAGERSVEHRLKVEPQQDADHLYLEREAERGLSSSDRGGRDQSSTPASSIRPRTANSRRNHGCDDGFRTISAMAAQGFRCSKPLVRRKVASAMARKRYFAAANGSTRPAGIGVARNLDQASANCRRF